ncbi:MAG: hypothetical protein LH465_08770 [Sphingomonas bacterium]|nr:hypothetical protein [Sphingomonas bacterium]
MDDKQIATAVPGWFRPLAGLALLWQAFGCYMYLTQIGADPAGLPLDQRAMWDATPSWMIAAYAVAVWVGLVGAGLLLLRRRLAVPLLLISVIAVVVQFSGLLLVPALRQITPSDALAMPIIIFVVAYGIYHLATLARKRGWLR